MKIIWSILIVLAMFGSQAQAAPLSEPQKIEALITSIEQLKGAVFIRNGSEYSGAQAAHHLRVKWDNAGSKVKTAEDFIDKCAAQSSMSGKKYRIRFGNGKTVDSEVYFRDELKKISPPSPLPSVKG